MDLSHGKDTIQGTKLGLGRKSFKGDLGPFYQTFSMYVIDCVMVLWLISLIGEHHLHPNFMFNNEHYCNICLPDHSLGTNAE